MTDIRIPASQVKPDPVSALIAAYHADLLKLEAAYIAACQERRTRFEREVNALLRPTGQPMTEAEFYTINQSHPDFRDWYVDKVFKAAGVSLHGD